MTIVLLSLLLYIFLYIYYYIKIVIVLLTIRNVTQGSTKYNDRVVRMAINRDNRDFMQKKTKIRDERNTEARFS